MATVLKAGNATTGGSFTPDSTGILEIKTGTGAGTTAISIDASQNVGIGTTTPGVKLDLYNGGSQLKLNMTASGNGFAITNDPSYTLFQTANAVYMGFGTNGAERMRIDSSGNLLVGTTAVRGPLTVQTAPSNSAYGQIAAFSAAASDVGNAGISVTKYDNVTTTSQIFVRFLINQGTTTSGQINANGASAAAFGSYSDRRLKENISDLPSQLENIMALRPVEFDYIESEGGGHQIGFIAQEVKEVYPDLVGEREDGMFTLTDLNKNDARLIKAIQEQQAMIEELKTKVAALEAK